MSGILRIHKCHSKTKKKERGKKSINRSVVAVVVVVVVVVAILVVFVVVFVIVGGDGAAKTDVPWPRVGVARVNVYTQKQKPSSSLK